jgi:hypothetical protein
VVNGVLLLLLFLLYHTQNGTHRTSDTCAPTTVIECAASRLKTWILKTKLADEFNPKSSHIYSEHFSADDFERNLKAELLNLKVKRQLKKSGKSDNY